MIKLASKKERIAFLVFLFSALFLIIQLTILKSQDDLDSLLRCLLEFRCYDYLSVVLFVFGFISLTVSFFAAFFWSKTFEPILSWIEEGCHKHNEKDVTDYFKSTVRGQIDSCDLVSSSSNIVIKYILDMWRGKIILPVMFWVWGVLFSCIERSVFFIIFSNLSNDYLIGLWLIISTLYVIFWIIGTWRSASHWSKKSEGIVFIDWGYLVKVLIFLNHAILLVIFWTSLNN